MNSAPATLAPPTRPFAGIYRQLIDYPEAKVESAIQTLLQGNAKSISALRVREILDAPIPAAVPADPIRTELAEAVHMVRVAASLTNGRKSADRLQEKVQRCATHAGLTDAEEATFQSYRRRFPHMGYLPTANAYEAEVCL